MCLYILSSSTIYPALLSNIYPLTPSGSPCTCSRTSLTTSSRLGWPWIAYRASCWSQSARQCPEDRWSNQVSIDPPTHPHPHTHTHTHTHTHPPPPTHTPTHLFIHPPLLYPTTTVSPPPPHNILYQHTPYHQYPQLTPLHNTPSTPSPPSYHQGYYWTEPLSCGKAIPKSPAPKKTALLQSRARDGSGRLPSDGDGCIERCSTCWRGLTVCRRRLQQGCCKVSHPFSSDCMLSHPLIVLSGYC